MDTISNPFICTALEYKNYLKDFYNANKDKKYIFNRKYLNRLTNKGLFISYNIIEENIDSDSDFNNWLRFVRYYIDFLYFAEKCYMYNFEDDSIYYELDNTKDISSIIIDNVDHKIKLEFQRSKINNINKSALDSYLDNDIDDTAIFVCLSIERTTSIGVDSNIKFNTILGSDLSNKSEIDLLLISNLRYTISNNIKKSFLNILDNYITNYCPIISKDITFERIISNDRLWIR